MLNLRSPKHGRYASTPADQAYMPPRPAALASQAGLHRWSCPTSAAHKHRVHCVTLSGGCVHEQQGTLRMHHTLT